ncbi:MAG TPA: phytanoyl-CoA dioxygenase family protein [Thermoanaerobaculia bacterium]|nr:phytanoyl-CoA dioxygenase family protein [Thermoanaerobaculia bacterium]
MEFVRLTAEQRKSFDEDGFLVVRKVLDAGTVQRATAAGDMLAQAFLNKPELRDRPEYNHLDLRPAVATEKPLLDLISHPTGVSYVMQLLGPNIHLHSTALIYKRPSPDAPAFRRGWHRDIRMPKDLGHQFLPRVGIKICYALTDFHESNSGMTLLARGTHMRTAPLVLKKGVVDPEGVEVCDLQLDAGDAFLFDNRLFHTAAPNVSNRTSKVVMLGYAYRWMKQEIYLETLDASYFKQQNPVTRQLLGGYRDIDTPPWALQQFAKRHGAAPEEIPWTVNA